MDLGKPGIGNLMVEATGAAGGEIVDLFCCEAINDDGSPVAGATVRLTVGFLGRETTVTTDATGRYALERVPLMTRAEQERLAERSSSPWSASRRSCGSGR